jgi:hypothetical protein
MSITSTTHLNFRGTAGQAVAFSRRFGGTLTSATYGDFGMPKEVPGTEKIVFGQVETADGFRLMAYEMLTPGYGRSARWIPKSVRPGRMSARRARVPR